MTLNVKVATLLLGLLVGVVAGYLTRPESAEIKIGSLHVEFDNNQVSTDTTGGMTSGQMRHILLFAVIGGVAGLLVGFAVDRRR